MKKRQRQVIIGSAVAAGIIYLLLKNRKTIPYGVTAIRPFDIEKYIGKWYEIARMDHTFENNLLNTSAEYSFNADGSIRVVNKGYNYLTHKHKTATGRAVFVDDAEEAKLKVSFFGPFYSGYNVIAIDPDYKYALVAGKNLRYLWLLSRTRTIPPEIKEHFLATAAEAGYEINSLTWVPHDPN